MELKIADEHLKPLKAIPTNLSLTGSLPNKIEAILFDIYGTLFISASGDISLAKQEAKQNIKIKNLFQRYNITLDPQEVFAQLFQEIEQNHQKLKNEGIDYPEIKIEKIWLKILNLKNEDEAQEFALEYELIVNPVYPMPNLEKLLEVCQKKNIVRGIISNAQFFTPLLFSAFLKKDLTEFGFAKELLFFSYQYNYAKPSQFLFNKALQALRLKNISPDNTLYVGNDMLNDIYPAQKAGFMTALFAGDKRSLRLRKEDERIKNISANLIITDLNQLISYLDS
ncbi:HAD family hydrolase [Candidatus Auribacterota bacterium]